MSDSHNHLTPPVKTDLPSVEPSTKPESLKSINKIVETVLSSDTPLEFIDKAKIDLLKVYKNLGRIALSAELMAKDRDGEPISLGPDNRSQIMATTLLLELAKHIKDKSVVTQVGIFNDPAFVAKATEEAQRVLALKDRMNGL